MSANNVWYVKKVGKTYYGWDTNAEATVDPDKHVLHLAKAHAKGKSIEEVEQKLRELGLYDAEYGLILQPYLPKDGTPIEVVV